MRHKYLQLKTIFTQLNTFLISNGGIYLTGTITFIILLTAASPESSYKKRFIEEYNHQIGRAHV